MSFMVVVFPQSAHVRAIDFRSRVESIQDQQLKTNKYKHPPAKTAEPLVGSMGRKDSHTLRTFLCGVGSLNTFQDSTLDRM